MDVSMRERLAEELRSTASVLRKLGLELGGGRVSGQDAWERLEEQRERIYSVAWELDPAQPGVPWVPLVDLLGPGSVTQGPFLPPETAEE